MLHVSDMQELTRLFELKERLLVCRVVITHLADRKTRACWKGNWIIRKQMTAGDINSRYENGEIHMIHRVNEESGVAGIQIDRTKCVGCGQCAGCPALIRMTAKKAEMRYPMECWGCVCQRYPARHDFPVFRSRYWRRRDAAV